MVVFLQPFHQGVTRQTPGLTGNTLEAFLVLLLPGTTLAGGKCAPAPQPGWAALVRKRALTIVLVDESVTDFVSCDLPVGFCRLSPAQLRHSRRHDVESQAARLAGDWKGKSEESGLPQVGTQHTQMPRARWITAESQQAPPCACPQDHEKLRAGALTPCQVHRHPLAPRHGGKQSAESLTLLKRAAVDDVRVSSFTQGVVGTDLHVVVTVGVEVTQLC